MLDEAPIRSEGLAGVPAHTWHLPTVRPLMLDEALLPSEAPASCSPHTPMASPLCAL